MISWAGRWTLTPSSTPLQPKKWNAHFWIMFNLWWLAGLVDGLKPHPPPISSQKNKMLIFGLCSTSDDRPGRSMDSNPVCHSSPAKKIKCSFLDYVQIVMIGRAGWWTWTCPPPLSSQKNKMLIFGLCSTSDDQLGWLMDSNTILHPSPAKKIKCSFLDYVQLLMIGRAGQWIQTPSTTPLQPKKKNAHFWIMFNFWWSAVLVDGLKCHLPPLSSQKNKMLILDYVQLLMIGCAGWWTQMPSATPLQPKNKMLIFGLCSTSDDWPGWLMGSNPIHHSSPAKKIKCSFLDYVQLLMIGWAGQWIQTQPPPLSSQKIKMLIFGLCSTSDDWPGWLMDSNPICHPSPAKK